MLELLCFLWIWQRSQKQTTKDEKIYIKIVK